MSPEMESLSDATLASRARFRQLLPERQGEIRIKRWKQDRVSEPMNARDKTSSETRPRVISGNSRAAARKRLRTSGFGSEKEWAVQVIDFSPVITIFHIFSPIFHPTYQPEGVDFSRVRRPSRGKLCDLARGENASEEIGIGNGGVAPTFKA